MSRSIEQVFDEALALPVESRATLIERLIASLNLPTQEEVDRLWAEEAERRVSQIERGEVDLVPGEQVFERISRL